MSGSETPELHHPSEDKNMWTKLQSSWTAISQVSQSRGKARLVLIAQIGHTLKIGSALQSLTALSVGEAEFYAVVKESHFVQNAGLGYSNGS